jgi:CheY-like chemotaxis protein
LTLPQNPLVVIVEDEPDTAEMLAEMLRISGYQVRKAFGGTAAIELIHAEKPQAVLLDIMMPDVSGLEVYRYIRRDPAHENIPVVFVSGSSIPAELMLDHDAGLTVYLMKPVGYAELTAALQKVIQNSSHKNTSD